MVYIIDINDNLFKFIEFEGYYFMVDEGKVGLIVGMVMVNKSFFELMVLKINF